MSSYYSRRSYDYESGGSSLWTSVVGIIVIFIISMFLSSAIKSSNRNDAGMVLIEDGYCYDQDSYIIYREYTSGRMKTRVSYSPYIDRNGHMCKYDLVTGDWIAFIETEEGMKELGISKSK